MTFASAQDGRPFELLKGSGFIRLAKQLFDTGRCLSSVTRIEIEDLLPDSTTVSLSYCGLSLNHIHQKFHSLSFLLGCFPFGLRLNDEKFIMSDNEPTMKSAFNLNFKRIGCSDHFINKQLQHAFTSQMIDGQVVNCELAQGMFSDVKHIVSNTRFSGAYGMLRVFQDVYNELDKILDSKLLTTYCKINEDFLHDVCEFLLPFDTAFQTLSDSKRATLHRVLPMKQVLINKCVIDNDDKEDIKQLKAFLGKRLSEKWKLSNEHLIATLIHPNLKHFHKCPHLKERAIFLLKQEMLKHQDIPSACPSVTTN
ncbi:unnamed protein product [Rotaria sp. Silwood1]|nr:unnamed protein product [Rotaria sp. Silwood1]CAF3757649.1 unnamed protein product [Rotaria sp. Silwood1]CAF4581356.1 unnamed protein product [Rotaria sp. Silwood1]CAF4688387.1 unnamed protein product [Rotaria sp. Silwood1]